MRLPHGITLHLDQAGPADGAPVLLLHGFPDTHRSWRGQLPALADAGFRAIAPDLRGYGGSSKPRRVVDYRVDALLDDIVALLDRLGLPRAHLVGHDWGGVLAWALAMRQPERIDRLVILNAPHPATYLRQLRSPDQLRRSWYVLAFQCPWLPERLLCRLARTHGMPPGPVRGVPPLPDPERRAYAAAFATPADLRGPVNYYRAVLRHDLRTARARLAPIPNPTLVLWGDQDVVLGPGLLDGLERWVPDLRVQRFRTAGHFVHQDQPDAVNDALVAFLRGGGGGD